MLKGFFNSNAFKGFWKGAISAVVSIATTVGIHAIFPSCNGYLCTAAGATTLLTAWSALAEKQGAKSNG
jgi:hypothetical protein